MSGHAIFINHRRDDAPDATERIYDRLVQEFTARAVFKDTAALQAGQNWEHAISATLAECRVVLAIVGPNWLSHLAARDPSHPDYVRLELEWAHKAGVQIVPVLANFGDNDAVPTVADLPDTLSFLPSLQVARVRRQDFHADMTRLISALKEGALTGVVEVEVPTSGPGAATANWVLLKDSFDVDDLRRFAESFPGTTEAFDARRRADQIENERRGREESERTARERAKHEIAKRASQELLEKQSRDAAEKRRRSAELREDEAERVHRSRKAAQSANALTWTLGLIFYLAPIAVSLLAPKLPRLHDFIEGRFLFSLLLSWPWMGFLLLVGIIRDTKAFTVVILLYWIGVIATFVAAFA